MSEIDEGLLRAARLLVDNHANAPQGFHPSAATMMAHAVLALHEAVVAQRGVEAKLAEHAAEAESRTAEAIAVWLDSNPRNWPADTELAAAIRSGAWKVKP